MSQSLCARPASVERRPTVAERRADSRHVGALRPQKGEGSMVGVVISNRPPPACHTPTASGRARRSAPAAVRSAGARRSSIRFTCCRCSVAAGTTMEVPSCTAAWPPARARRRRRRPVYGAAHRLDVQLQPPRNLFLRYPFHQMQVADLGPLTHPDHLRVLLTESTRRPCLVPSIHRHRNAISSVLRATL